MNSKISIILGELSNIMLKKGEGFRAKAYNCAKDIIDQYPKEIISTNQLKDIPNIGKSSLLHIDEFLKTGKVQIIEEERNNPVNIFADIYGIGPKKAKELVETYHIHTIDTLRENQHQLLNNIQQIGLKYYEDILKRIPRQEIKHYHQLFEKVANTQSQLKFEIVGSYRRGAQDSGDIDVILTSPIESHYVAFIELLIKSRIIVEVLSRGKSKCLVIAKLPDMSSSSSSSSSSGSSSSSSSKHTNRRIDFLFAPAQEYAFSLLYFTGSKIFNTNMRAHAQKQGYSLNEHGLLNTYTNKMVEQSFHTEQDIFQFLKMEYILPEERKGELKYIKKGLKEVMSSCGGGFLNLSQEELKQMIDDANKAYHSGISSGLSDNEFDIMKEYYENKFHKIVEVGTEVGTEETSINSSKVLLPYEMWSMDKIKPDTTALENWKKTYSMPSCQYVISCKLDGVSGLLCYQNNKINLYTRGNGKIGQDISHLIPYLRLPKLNMNYQSLIIRGEFIISKKTFQSKYSNIYANARNLVAGIINRNHVDKEKIGDIDFISYEVIEPINLYPSTQHVLLKKYGFNCVYSTTISLQSLTNEYLSKLLIETREKYEYDTDGLICCHDKVYPRISGNPKHAFAFKMVLQDQMAEAKVIDVLWSASKDGYMKPRVQIEPIILGGVTIEFATGFNAGFIKQHGIGFGAIVQIIRSGDVIPHIVKVCIPSPQGPKMPGMPNMPNTYKWSESGVDIILSDISSSTDVKEKTITNFFKKIEVDGLGPGTVAKLIASGYDSIEKICNMKQEDFLLVDGFAAKMATKIHDGICQQLKKTSIIKIMVASNIFGRGFSDGKIATILDSNPNILDSNPNTPSLLPLIKGISEKSLLEFISHIPEFNSFYSVLKKKMEQIPSIEEKGIPMKVIYDTIYSAKFPKSSIIGKIIVLTGFRDKNFIEYIEQNGGKIAATVTKKTSFVIAKDSNDSSSKIDDAKKYNIPIYFL